MRDAYDTPFDRYDTPFDGDEETRAIDARLDQIAAMFHDMNARLDRFVRLVRWGMLCYMVYSTVLMVVLVYVKTSRQVSPPALGQHTRRKLAGMGTALHGARSCWPGSLCVKNRLDALPLGGWRRLRGVRLQLIHGIRQPKGQGACSAVTSAHGIDTGPLRMCHQPVVLKRVLEEPC